MRVERSKRARFTEPTMQSLGPSTAKLQFLRYVHKQAEALEPKIVGIETVDHPPDGQLIAYAKHYFGIPDRQR